MTDSLVLTGYDLHLEDLAGFDATRPPVSLDAAARERMLESVASVRSVVESGAVRYGINTGFGALARKQISPSETRQLQYNLVRSHACGVGEPLAPHLVRRLMLLKANSLAAGFSGIRPDVVETLIALLNHDVLPVIPGRGSVGASGDLAPLAHLALALIGEGEADHNGKRLEGKAVLEAAGMRPVELEAKEGLALLNGTQLSATLAIEGWLAGRRLLASAIVSGAFAVEALAGSYSPFDDRIHEVRRMPGQRRVANAFRSLLTGSEIWEDHRHCGRVQDPYALRCMPQVYGACLDTLDHAERLLEQECNSVSDNPLIFGEDVISGGNFHAEPLAFLSDFLAIAISELGSITERRIDLLVRQVNPNLPMFLTATAGVESGFMIAHVTAAALASENKGLAHPASVDSIPTSAGQEDHVSMAPWAGHKLLRICDNVGQILAVELLAAAVAIDIQRPLKTTPQLEDIHAAVRRAVPPHEGDRRLDRDINTVAELVANGVIAAPVIIPST